MDNASDLYLNLMKRCLTNWIYGETEVKDVFPAICGIRVVKQKPFDQKRRVEGRDLPSTAHTMIGLKRLDNLQFCVEDVLANNIPGDLIETGVWRGGATIFMRAILKAHGVEDRVVWVADSFEGVPPPNNENYPSDAGDRLYTHKALKVSMEQVKENFERYGLRDKHVRFLQGWFRETLPNSPIERLAVMRLDGDLYESTMDALVHLYPKLSPGGYVIVDDYGAIANCRQAVEDYRVLHGIKEEIVWVDWTAIYWRRS